MWHDNLPPGTPRGRDHREHTLVCSNEDCEEFDSPREVTLVYERDTGAAWIDPEEDEYCEVCGQEMVDR
jgi:hypothetical protein